MMKYLVPVIVVALMTGAAGATPTIIVGDIHLLPNQANQMVPIRVTGGDAVQGLALECQIADGGPGWSGTIAGPAITRVDVLSMTIFAANNTGMWGSLTGQITPQVASRGTTTFSGTVPADGLIATLYVDTTGYTTIGQSWDLRLTGTRNGDTVFGQITPNITNGTITIGTVPEPASISLLVAGAVMLVRRRRRA